MGNKKGVSYIEISVTISIILLLVGMTVPALFKFVLKHKLEASTREIATILKTARSYAIMNNKDCEVILPVSATGAPSYEYRSIKLYQNGQTIEEWKKLKDGIIFDSRTAGYSTFLADIKQRPFPNDTDAPIDVAVIRFKPNGASANNGTLCIKFENNNQAGRKITAINTTGRLEISEYNP